MQTHQGYHQPCPSIIVQAIVICSTTMFLLSLPVGTGGRWMKLNSPKRAEDGSWNAGAVGSSGEINGR